MSRIAVLGTGRMGGALASAFARAGHEVTVWNRTVAKAKPLEALHVRIAGSLVEAVAAADLVVGNVSDYTASAAILWRPEIERALQGRTYLELASGTPKEAQRAAEWAKENRIHYLDGAIMATPSFIGEPGCVILYSGPAGLYDTHRSTLAALGDGALHVGVDIGHASVLDNAILVVLWGSVLGLFQGAAICEAERLPIATFAGALKGSWPVVEPLLQAALERIAQRRWTADATTQSTLAPGFVTAEHLLEMSREYGIDPSLPEAVHRVFGRAVAKGHREDDIAAAYEGLR